MEFDTITNQILKLIDQEEIENALNLVNKILQEEKYTQLQEGTDIPLEIWEQKWHLLLHKCTLLEIIGRFKQTIAIADEIVEESRKFGSGAEKSQ